MIKLRTPGSTPLRLRAIHANEGVRAAYRRELEALIEEQHVDVSTRILSAYRDRFPHIAKDDLSPISDSELNVVMEESLKQWRSKFEKVSGDIAKQFADECMTSVSSSFKNALREAGFSVKANMASYIKDELDRIVEDNVELINSIGEKYLEEVSDLVRESVEQGRNLSDLTDMLEERYGVSRSRAELIARDQNNKASANITRLQQKHFGITQARWIHTSASVHPREEHEAWNGEIYDIEEGMFSEEEQEQQWPGTAINCGCVCESIIPEFGEEDEMSNEEE